MGNRILKKLLDINTQKTTKTFYTRDAQGNVLSIYENGKQKTYRDDNGNIYYFNAPSGLSVPLRPIKLQASRLSNCK